MADTSSTWQSRDNVPQGDPNVIHLYKELHDHGQAIVELTTTMNQLAKAQLQQVQGPKQVNAMEGVNEMVNKRRQRGQQVQHSQDQFEQSGSGHNQDDSYDDQSEEVQYVNNYQGQQSNAPNQQQWRSQENNQNWGNQGQGNWNSGNNNNSNNWGNNNQNWVNQGNNQASHNTSIRNLEVQMGQTSQALNTRPKGALSGDTVVNPKGENNTGHAMAVTTRSGRGGVASTSNLRKIVNDDVVVQEKDEPRNDENMNNEVRINIDENVEETQDDVNPFREHVIDIPDPVVPKAKAPFPRPPPPYPQRLAK
ncbi:uncharacterized protein [Nicotiana tomentosiformis]|uniref:uncharacterized protein n=1 Tax=Nicotiana tomentosiformis TaxID=4098 RepID=UPI00388CA83E